MNPLDHEGLIVKEANRHKKNIIDHAHVGFDDLIQEGWISVMKAIESYEESKGAVTTWVSKHINTAIIGYLRKHKVYSNGSAKIDYDEFDDNTAYSVSVEQELEGVQNAKQKMIDYIKKVDNDKSLYKTKTYEECRRGLGRKDPNSVSGVCWRPKRNRYRARIYSGKQQILLGFFKERSDAEDAVRKKRRELNKVKGAFWMKDRKLWKAALEHKKKRYYLGYHKTKKQAEAALTKKRKELGIL